MCVLLIDLDVEERGNLIRLLRRSLAARLGVRDRAEARAVGKRDEAVQIFWADGDFCSRLGLGRANRGAPPRVAPSKAPELIARRSSSPSAPRES